jgi:hypothetical protein
MESQELNQAENPASTKPGPLVAGAEKFVKRDQDPSLDLLDLDDIHVILAQVPLFQHLAGFVVQEFSHVLELGGV